MPSPVWMPWYWFWWSIVVVAYCSSLWEKSCPVDCSCTVEPWPYIQLDAKVMRCENRSLEVPPRNLTTETEVLILQQNHLGGATDFNLYDFRYLQSLRFLDLSANRIRVLHTHSIAFPQVRYLNLSHNDIHTIQTEVLNDFPALEHLNLESNYIGSLTIAAFSLPQLQYLNLRRNKIFTLKPHFYFNSPQLHTLILSHNFLSRLPDSIFFRAPQLDKLDLSYNRLSRIDDLAFDGLRSVSELNLEGNVLRRVPSIALRTVARLGHLTLNRNPLRELDQSSFAGVSASHVTLCHCDELSVVHSLTFADLTSLVTVELCSNRMLTSIAPRTFVGLSRLRTLDLQNNNLNVLEETVRADRYSLSDTDDVTSSGLYDSSATSTGKNVGSETDGHASSVTTGFASDAQPAPGGVPLTLRVSGNPFICDCNLKWVQDILTRQYGHNVTVSEGGNSVKCLDRTRDTLVSVLDMDDLPSHCAPFVLPLFHPVVKETVASDVSFMCRGVGIPPPKVFWILPDGRHLANDLCEDRACVMSNALSIKYLHVQDSGLYECRAENTMGEFKRSLHLEVENVNVLLFALTVTSTFVTLAWNASGIPANEYLLQYNPSESNAALSPTSSLLDGGGAAGIRGGGLQMVPPRFQNENRKVIEMGTKVHSYTVSDLTPGETYTFWLCIKRADYAIKVSRLEVTTREEGFLLMLGIRRNYVSVILIGSAAGIVVLGCATLCCVKLCRWARQEHSEMVASDSGSGRCFVKSESCNSEVAFMTYINVAEDTILVDNEDESPQ